MTKPKTFRTKIQSKWTEHDYNEWKRDLGARLRRKIYDVYGRMYEKKFAKMIGISPGSLSGILNGESTPSAASLLKIQRNSLLQVADILGGYYNGQS
jgi:transcriptional regulator with XRE-family HTH domain